MQFIAMVVDSLRESLDRKIFWVMVAVTFLVVLSMLSLGFEENSVTFFFGMWKQNTDHFNPVTLIGRRAIISGVVHVVLDFFLGWIGVLLMIVATGGMLPSLMQRGAIDVVLAKPINRPRLFLYKYLSILVFALLQAVLFVGLTFLVMGFHWKVWVPGYLLSIPLLVLLFSYVFCISALVATKTESTIAAILLSLVAWVFFAMPPIGLEVFEKYPELQQYTRSYQSAQLAAWVVPKTGDIPYFAAKWAGGGY